MSMKEIKIEKVTINMGVGTEKEDMKKSEQVIKLLTGKTPIKLKTNKKVPDWGLRPGLPVGLKVTLRKNDAKEFLEKTFKAKEDRILKKNFDQTGNFGFGIKEHIDLEGINYDPKIGIKGFDVLVTLERSGYRVKKRKIKSSKVGKKHLIKKEEAIEFVKQMGVEVE